MPVAYSYIRFSTTEQRKGDSLRRQVELSEQYATEHNLTLDNSLRMHDLGLSAFNRSNIERGALGGFLEAVRQGRIEPGSYLLVESLDRLSRDKVLAALELFISILRHGITIVTLADRMVYSTESVGSNFGNLIISITIMARAHEESATKSRRISAAWESKRAEIGKKKLTAQCPRWLRLSDDRSEFEFIPERVQVVREILAWHKSGLGQAQIAKRLNERVTPHFSSHGSGWHPSYIQKIVNSTALYGEFQPHLWKSGTLKPVGEPVAGYYPPLITKEEFDLLSYLRSTRKHPGARARKGLDVPNLFSGIVKCGYCGGTMVLAGGASQRIRSEDGTQIVRPSKKVLVCDGARRGLGCYAVQWEYKAFETSFLSFCRTIELRKLLDTRTGGHRHGEHVTTLAEELQLVTLKLTDCDVRLERLLNVLEAGDPPSTIVERIRNLEIERDRLEAEKKVIDEKMKSFASTICYESGQADSVRDTIRFLETVEGDERLEVRSQLAQHIRHLVKSVSLYPAGRLVPLQDQQRIREQLINDGFDEERVNSYIADNFRAEPLRTGRGVRGRYVSRKDISRNFVIRANSGAIRIVFPDFDNPSELVVELGEA